MFEGDRIISIILQCTLIFKHTYVQTKICHLYPTVSKLKVYDKNNCTMVFMININSYMYGEMILGIFEIPSIEMAITPTFFEQIGKFRCLSSSTPQGLSHDTWHTHVARVHVPENVS